MRKNHYAAIGAAVVVTIAFGSGTLAGQATGEAGPGSRPRIPSHNHIGHVMTHVEGHAGHAGISAGRDRRCQGRSDARGLHAEVAGQSRFA